MKKIGVITHYYNSINYGGLLQAYALVRVLSKLGLEGEQLCLDQKYSDGTVIPKKREAIKPSVLWMKQKACGLIRRLNASRLQLRNEVLHRFELSIPHTEEVLPGDDISRWKERYDAFITGSDQVWNLDWYHKEYFLDFVPEGKKKLSYAASMPNVNLSEEQKQLVAEHLKSFTAISVREQKTAAFLADLTGKKVEWVLDPTLLLSKKDWGEICTERLVQKKYIFCYFLGTDKEYRKLARRFAKKTGHQIVTLPFLRRANGNDVFFGHKKLYDISPGQFITLIRDAEFVLTDSFHASVFANLFQTKYYVFDRTGSSDMSSRITSLLSLTGEEFRYCAGKKQNLSYLLEHKDKKVSSFTEDLQNMQETSMAFLRINLNQL